jgi:hypothetical protein
VEVRHFIYLDIAMPDSPASSSVNHPLELLASPFPNLSFQRLPFAVLDSVPFPTLFLPTTLLSRAFFRTLLSQPATTISNCVDLSFRNASSAPTRKSHRPSPTFALQ